MPASELLQLVKNGAFEEFESKCLQALESGTLRLADLVPPFKHLEDKADAQRVATLGQMVLENGDSESDPAAALVIARTALVADPKNDSLRNRLIALYPKVHGEKKGFAGLLDISGISKGRPARNAIRLIEMCLSLQPGEPLLSRAEEAIAEVVEVDLANGLATLRQGGRPRTITPVELTREYERISADDFRVMRALYPDKITELLDTDAVRVVIGLIHAHGEMISQDRLKHDLVPTYIPSSKWSKWWTSTRAAMKRSPHIVMEGRNPVMLRYTAEARTLEDEAWELFETQTEPEQWLTVYERYLRDKQKERHDPDTGLLVRFQEFLLRYLEPVRERRPVEAFACALIANVIAEKIGDGDDRAQQIVTEMIGTMRNPTRTVASLPSDALWNLALDALVAADQDRAIRLAVELFTKAPATLLNRLATLVGKSDQVAEIQSYIDMAQGDPVDYPEITYWLWKGPTSVPGLQYPDRGGLFRRIMQTLNALGRTLDPGPEVTKNFRHRIRAAFALRSFDLVRQCIQELPADYGVTLRNQLERLDGLGDTAQAKMLAMLHEVHPQLWAVKHKRIEIWDDLDVLYSTGAGIQRKIQERDQLVNVTMRENAKRIGEAASHGDLSENSEYKYALEERDLLRARLAQMNNDLEKAEKIEEITVSTDRVSIGSHVTLRRVADGETRELSFLGPFDADVEKGILNYRAPFSLQIMGLSVGDQSKVSFEGADETWEVIRIAPALSESAV